MSANESVRQNFFHWMTKIFRFCLISVLLPRSPQPECSRCPLSFSCSSWSVWARKLTHQKDFRKRPRSLSYSTKFIFIHIESLQMLLPYFDFIIYMLSGCHFVLICKLSSALLLISSFLTTSLWNAMNFYRIIRTQIDPRLLVSSAVITSFTSEAAKCPDWKSSQFYK